MANNLRPKHFSSGLSDLGNPKLVHGGVPPTDERQVERYNRTILAALRAYVTEHLDDWDASRARSPTATTPKSIVLRALAHWSSRSVDLRYTWPSKTRPHPANPSLNWSVSSFWLSSKPSWAPLMGTSDRRRLATKRTSKRPSGHLQTTSAKDR